MRDEGEGYRLGLDVGTNSIGWAAISLGEGGEPRGVLDMGVRIFADGRDSQSAASNAADRRTARGERRRRSRYVDRRRRLQNALAELGLAPADKSERALLESLDPYDLRARALDEALSPSELGRVLFHLNQRRGFKSNRKSNRKTDGGDEAEKSKMRERMSNLSESLRASGERTLGEYLAARRRVGETVLARPDEDFYPDRAMLESEFDAIRDAQAPTHSLSAGDWARLRDLIFYQRPLKPADPGLCRFEEGEKRAPRALPSFQEFRILQDVNNLRVTVGTDPERELDESERERVLNRLRSGMDVKLTEKDGKPVLRHVGLRLPAGATLNLSAGGRAKIAGDETAAKLGKPKLFGRRWAALSRDERDEIVRFLLDAEDPNAVVDKARSDWGLDAAQAEAVARVSPPSGYASLSEKAIRKMIPHLERGEMYSDAAQSAGYDSHSDFRNADARGELPYYGEVLTKAVVGGDPSRDPNERGEAERYGRVSNPTVHIGMNQLRRVVNALIAAYGKPSEIVVELARELKMDRERKLVYERRRRENERSNERHREALESAGLQNTRDNRRKLRLWEEQGDVQSRFCPYTGERLSFEMVTSAQTEVDHILPFSRTLDNSMANMVVCVAGSNRVKRDRSPFEAFENSPAGYDYDAMRARAANLPGNKRWRFQPNAMERYENEERGFLDRQLTETRYLSRLARAYLACLYEASEGLKVRVIRGGIITALLRRGWGLNGMLGESPDGETRGKQRDDHRHHAIDAFIVANTTQGLLQQFSRAAGRAGGDVLTERLESLVPDLWDGFSREYLKDRLDKIIVSHKPDRGSAGANGGTSGKLHNATAYGLIEPLEDGETTHRKPVSEFKERADLKKVRNDGLKAELMALWDEVHAEGGTAADFAERAKRVGVSRRNGRRRVGSVRVVENLRVVPICDQSGRPYKGYKTDGNEFADIWRMRDGSWKIVVVPTFHANQPDFDVERFRPTTSRGKHRGKPDPVAKRIARIYKNDMCALGEGDERRIVRVRKITNPKRGSPRIFLDPHNESNMDARVKKKETADTNKSAKTLREQGFRPIRVDAIGRVLDPGPFPP